MAFLNNNKAMVAFKNLLNKSNTDVEKELGNEAEGIFFNVRGEDVWTSVIDANPSNAISAGIAQLVNAEMVEDATSNGHAFFAVYPTSISSGVGVLEIGKRYVVTSSTADYESQTYNQGSAFTAESEDLASGTVKEMVKGAIPPAFGVGYEATPKIGGTPIPVGDPRDWIYQYNSGVFFQQDNVGSDPTHIDVYVYTGLTGAVVKLNVNSENLSPNPTSGDEQSTGIILGEDPRPESGVKAWVNGKKVGIGDGVKTDESYFSADGGTTAKNIRSVQTGDEFFWNGNVAGYDLDGVDKIDFLYLI